MNWREPALVGLMLALTPVAAASDERSVSAHDAWVRQSPPGVTVMAGYMTIRNHTPRSQVILGARSSDYKTVMIHRTAARDGMSGMEHAPQIELPPKASLTFAPGGYHLMLMSPKRTLRTGDQVVINLEFRGGLVLPVAFEVRK